MAEKDSSIGKWVLLFFVILLLVLIFSGCELTVNPIKTYHTVFFHSNGQTGGTVPVFFITALVESTVNVPGNTGNLVKEDHQFVGWNTEADGSGNFFYPGDQFAMPAGNVVLYAAWERIYQVGQTGPAGGIVFYDKGTKSDGWRYLEAAPVVTEWVGRIWGVQDAIVIQGTSNAIGTGKANTQLILDGYQIANKGNYAASLCAHLEYGGYHDWFLPSLNELHEMQNNLYLYSLGSFSDDNYWSSSASYVDEPNNPYMMYFTNGNYYTSSTHYERYVRAVRSF